METLIGYLVFFIALLVTAIDVFAIQSISKFPLDRRRRKWAWTNIVMLLPIVGGLIYFYVGKKDLLANSAPH